MWFLTDSLIVNNMKSFAAILLLVVITCGIQASEPVKSEAAQQLMQLLNQVNGHQTLSATMACVNWNISEAQWVHQHTGKWPAIATFDLIHLPWSSKGGWIDYDDISLLEEWHKQGGIISIGWHWNVPARSGKSDKYAFYWGTDKGKEDEQTVFDVKKIFDSSSSEYKLMMQDIDRVAGILLKLKEKGIPVLWRPLHEAGGMWFWWGRDPDGCNELWRTMYHRFQQLGVDNLVWVWTQSSAWGKPYSDGYRWYPGDEYVDVVGIDIYNEWNATTIRTKCYDFLKEYSPTKFVALTECGSVPDMGQQWQAGAHWLWFMPWYDYAVTSDVNSTAFRQTQHGNANISWWNEAFSHDYVLTRDDVKAMLTSGISAPATDTHQKCRKGIYTLSGSRVQSPRRGIYIIDGKKVIKNHPASCY